MKSQTLSGHIQKVIFLAIKRIVQEGITRVSIENIKLEIVHEQIFVSLLIYLILNCFYLEYFWGREAIDHGFSRTLCVLSHLEINLT